MTEKILSFLLNDIGGVLITNDKGEFVYKDDNLFLSDSVNDVWEIFCPEINDEDNCIVWELPDKKASKYYLIKSKVNEVNGEKLYFHQLTDVTKLIDYSKNLTSYSSEIRKKFEFLVSVLKKISEKYYSFLPEVCELFKTKKVIMYLKKGEHVEKTIYDSEKDEFDRKKELVNNQFEIEKGEIRDGFICYCNDKLQEWQCVIMLKEEEGILTSELDNVMYSNNIILYMENGLLHEKMRYENEHDHLTGLYNKGKYLRMLEHDFNNYDSIAIFNLDVNNLKKVNDTMGHEMGDKLIIKAANSVHMVEGENVFGFRMGGDEFMLIAKNVSKEEALQIKDEWENSLKLLNEKEKDLECIIACGMAYGKGGYDLEKLFREADELMYEDKKSKKKPGEEIR
ncbi:diguanylate cyclase (GGDEF) domain-containing protein [Lachnospiraceae bacterium RM5]|nr:diguanylate cyclase (GGDEF) domain-containing protein [Lachnospiraceae bacterium RM5]